MQLKLPLITFLVFLSAVAANGPIFLTPGQHDAAVEVDQQDARVYYQDADTSIKEIAPHFPAGTGRAGITLIVPPGEARNNTPIAAVVLQSDGWFGEACCPPIHVFYFGTAFDNQQLCEKVWKGGWSDGPLNGYAYTSRASEQFLYAITDGNQVESSSTICVGFACEGASV